MNSKPGFPDGPLASPPADRPADRIADIAAGTAFGPVAFDVSESANDRYWEAAGITHPARDARVLYPPMATNLTILAFQTIAPASMLQTGQRLECRAQAHAPNSLTVTGTVTSRFERRGREYAEVTTTTTDEAGTVLWISVSTFTEAGA